jgi:hypothetical protein
VKWPQTSVYISFEIVHVIFRRPRPGSAKMAERVVVKNCAVALPTELHVFNFCNNSLFALLCRVSVVATGSAISST